MPCFFTRWGEGPEQLESDKDCSDTGDLKGCKGLLSCGNMNKLLLVFFLFLLGVAAVHGEDGEVPRTLSSDLQFYSAALIWSFGYVCSWLWMHGSISTFLLIASHLCGATASFKSVGLFSCCDLGAYAV